MSLLAALALLAGADSATAQFVPLPNPVPPAVWPLTASRFYMQAGVRYRSIDTLRIRQEQSQITYEELGVPAFGPNVTGEFGTGTGVAGYPTNPLLGNLNPNLSGFWQYNNGFINSSAPPLDPTAAAGTFPYPQLPEVMLGRFVHTPGGGGATSAYNIGSFQINDTFLQVDNPVQLVRDPVIVTGLDRDFERPSDVIVKISSVAETTRVSWSRLIDGTYPAGSPEVQSRLFDGTGFAFDAGFAPGLWTASIEFGYQASSFFDVFYGFSSFNFDATASRSAIIQANFGRRGFTDTFSFYSNLPNTWRIKDFNSASALQPCGDPISRCRGCGNDCTGSAGCDQDCQTLGVGGCPDCPNEFVANYRIWPDGVGQGAYPVRQFYEVFPADAQKENLNEEISQRVDVGVRENRFGGRSWTPIYGIGRLGVSLGALLSPISYRISGTKRVTSLGPRLPGTIFENIAEVRTGVWWNVGVFVGTDLQIQYGSLFARGAVEYSACRNQSASLFQVETTVNPGGFATLLSAGFTF